ncbi:hypothetical protein BESB_084330 [Besnoitia besnoiti]|uniref:Uncharacterized protein n=1 Tax=Besnoitia besnoiti TaxID=94643 RepID=A0A2A9M7T0_BESBE|nr:hypothetical protein BESB_084330 [Besnoitia besnoiti]PFH33234.1 hypothetical protein BESB_084330 [Besnoitia besnoiti]
MKPPGQAELPSLTPPPFSNAMPASVAGSPTALPDKSRLLPAAVSPEGTSSPNRLPVSIGGSRLAEDSTASQNDHEQCENIPYLGNRGAGAGCPGALVSHTLDRDSSPSGGQDLKAEPMEGRSRVHCPPDDGSRYEAGGGGGFLRGEGPASPRASRDSSVRSSLDRLSAPSSAEVPSSRQSLANHAGCSPAEAWSTGDSRTALLLDEDEDVVMLKGEDCGRVKELRDELMARVSHARLRQLRDLFLDPHRKATRAWSNEEIELLQADYRQNHEDWVEVLQPWQATPLHLQSVPFTYSVLKKAPLKFPAVFCKHTPFFFPHPSGIGVFHAILVIERRPKEKVAAKRGGGAASPTSPKTLKKTAQGESETCRREDTSPLPARRCLSRGGGRSAPSLQNTAEPLTEDVARLVLVWEPYQQLDGTQSFLDRGDERGISGQRSGRRKTSHLAFPSPCSATPALELPDDGLQPGAYAHIISGRLSLSSFSAFSKSQKAHSPRSEFSSVPSHSSVAASADHCASPFAFTAVQSADTGEGGAPASARTSNMQHQEAKRLLRLQRLQHKLLQELEEAEVPELVFEGRVVGCELHGFLPFEERRRNRKETRKRKEATQQAGEGLPATRFGTETDRGSKKQKTSEQQLAAGAAVKRGTEKAAMTEEGDAGEGNKEGELRDREQADRAGEGDSARANLTPEKGDTRLSALQRQGGEQRAPPREESSQLGESEAATLGRLHTQNGIKDEDEGGHSGTQPAAACREETGTREPCDEARLGIRQRMLLCVRLEDDRIFLYEIRSFINHSSKALVEWEGRVRAAEREIAIAAGSLPYTQSSCISHELPERRRAPEGLQNAEKRSLPLSSAVTASSFCNSAAPCVKGEETKIKQSTHSTGALIADCEAADPRTLHRGEVEGQEKEVNRNAGVCSFESVCTLVRQRGEAAAGKVHEVGRAPSAALASASIVQQEERIQGSVETKQCPSRQEGESQHESEGGCPSPLMPNAARCEGLNSGALSSENRAAAQEIASLPDGWDCTSFPAVPDTPAPGGRPLSSGCPSLPPHTGGESPGRRDSAGEGEAHGDVRWEASCHAGGPTGSNEVSGMPVAGAVSTSERAAECLGERRQSTFVSELHHRSRPPFDESQQESASPGGKTSQLAYVSLPSAQSLSSLPGRGPSPFPAAGSAAAEGEAEETNAGCRRTRRVKKKHSDSGVVLEGVAPLAVKEKLDEAKEAERTVSGFRHTSRAQRRAAFVAEDEGLAARWIDCDDPSSSRRRRATSPSKRVGLRGGAGRAFPIAPLAILYDLQWSAEEVRELAAGQGGSLQSSSLPFSCSQPLPAGQDAATCSVSCSLPALEGQCGMCGGRELDGEQRADSSPERQKAGLPRQDVEVRNSPSSVALRFFFSICEEDEDATVSREQSLEAVHQENHRGVATSQNQGKTGDAVAPRCHHTTAEKSSDPLGLDSSVKFEISEDAGDVAHVGNQENASPGPQNICRRREAPSSNRAEGGATSREGLQAADKTQAEKKMGCNAAAEDICDHRVGNAKRRRKIAILSHLAAVAGSAGGCPSCRADCHTAGGLDALNADKPARCCLGSPSSPCAYVGGKVCVWRLEPLLGQLSTTSRAATESELRLSPKHSCSSGLHPQSAFACDPKGENTAAFPALSQMRNSASPPQKMQRRSTESPGSPVCQRERYCHARTGGLERTPEASSTGRLEAGETGSAEDVPSGSCASSSLLLCGGYFPPHCSPMDVSATPGKTYPIPATERGRMQADCCVSLQEHTQANGCKKSLGDREDELPVMITVDTGGFLRAWKLSRSLAVCFAAQRVCTGPLLAVSVNQQLPSLAAVGAGDGRVRICDISTFLTKRPQGSQLVSDVPLSPVRKNASASSDVASTSPSASPSAKGSSSSFAPPCGEFNVARCASRQPPSATALHSLQTACPCTVASPLVTLPSHLGEDLYRVFGRRHPVKRLQWLAGGALLGVVHDQPESEKHLAAFGSCAALWAPGKDVFDEVNDAAHHKLFWARAAKHPQAAKFSRLICVHVAHAVAALDRCEGATSRALGVYQERRGSQEAESCGGLSSAGGGATSSTLLKAGSAHMLSCDFLFSRRGGICGISTDTASMLHYWKPGSWLVGDVEDIGVLARKTADKEQLSRALHHVTTQITLRSQASTRAEKAKMLRQAEIAEDDVERATQGESLPCTREALMRPWQKFLAVRPVTRVLMENLRAEIQDEAALFDKFAESGIQWFESK